MSIKWSIGYTDHENGGVWNEWADLEADHVPHVGDTISVNHEASDEDDGQERTYYYKVMDLEHYFDVDGFHTLNVEANWFKSDPPYKTAYEAAEAKGLPGTESYPQPEIGT